MKLLTLNLLCCPKCATFPLNISSSPTQQNEIQQSNQQQGGQKQEPNYILLANLYRRLDFEALKAQAAVIGIGGLPEKFPDEFPVDASKPINNQTVSQENLAFVNALYTLLFHIELVNCELQCSHCERVFPVKDKIANLVLNENEIQEKGKYMKERGTKRFIVIENS